MYKDERKIFEVICKLVVWTEQVVKVQVLSKKINKGPPFTLFEKFKVLQMENCCARIVIRCPKMKEK